MTNANDNNSVVYKRNEEKETENIASNEALSSVFVVVAKRAAVLIVHRESFCFISQTHTAPTQSFTLTHTLQLGQCGLVSPLLFISNSKKNVIHTNFKRPVRGTFGFNSPVSFALGRNQYCLLRRLSKATFISAHVMFGFRSYFFFLLFSVPSACVCFFSRYFRFICARSYTTTWHWRIGFDWLLIDHWSIFNQTP